MNASIKIKISDIIGSNLGVSSEDGGAVFEKLEIALKAERPVELDFSGIEMVISAFLNAAIGRLLQKRKISEIRSQISFTNISQDDLELIDRVLENAERYYEDPDRFRKSLEGDDEK